MSEANKAVFFFCTGAADHVAGHVLAAVADAFDLRETEKEVDGFCVLVHTDPVGNEFHFVRTGKVLSHDYTHFLPVLDRFSGCDLAGIITWHEGANAPDRILTAHTTGDVNSGIFGSARPDLIHNLFIAMERNRKEEGLEDYTVIPEATHWSGMIYGGGDPSLILRYPVPLLDIEIGSSPASWSNHAAARALARSLLQVFDSDGRRVRNILCAGGVHFEPGFASVLFQPWGDSVFGVSHILANQWLMTGGYDDEEGGRKLERCAESISGGIEGIVFHDNLKGPFKDRLRELGNRLGVPVFKHQGLRKPHEIQWKYP